MRSLSKLDVTTPHRRDEMERSKIEIYDKLTTAVAELLCTEDEIVRGCRTCREN